jgi:aminoglycoside phosphotransferase family enzyme
VTVAADPAAQALERVPLADKVAFLGRPESYGRWKTVRVEARQTHMAWVFLTDRLVFKLKKPVRYPFLDFGTIAARLHDCREEVRLNRRLAPDVYLGIEPLTLAADGGLHLGAHGDVVDWLVVMRRLPAELMLDELLKHGPVDVALLDRLGDRLVAFYAAAERVRPSAPGAYAARLRASLDEAAQELARPDFALPADRVATALGRQLEFVAREGDLLASRLADGRVVEGHGDLRPEHVCLEPLPVIIDCLEFNRDLRLVDALDELAFLAIECEMLGSVEVGARIIDRYRQGSGDRAPERLVGFYKSFRATLRARLLARHSLEPGDHAPQFYLGRARDYLGRALTCTEVLA